MHPGLTSSRDSSSIVAKELVSDDSDDEDVEYKGHFCSRCSIPPPGGVRGWVRGYGGVGFWEADPGCWVCVLRRLRLREFESFRFWVLIFSF